jgi:aspartyl-tRNA(Asn)/glutamyl-tRNA(Gln) amidotransferase subunit A
VAGGIVTIATGGDGGGSIRIPAAFCGLPGLKTTYGRIPKGPSANQSNFTSVSGCLSRSVRDIARFLDVASGWDPRDPFSLEDGGGWEAGLGTHVDELRGLRVAVRPNLGVATVAAATVPLIEEHAAALIADAGLEHVDVPVAAAESSYEWALSGLVSIRRDLGDRWPECAGELTPQIRFGLDWSRHAYDLDTAARIEEQRVVNTERMAAIFDQVDLVISATNPDVAFRAEGPLPTVVDDREVDVGNNGALTVPANFYGNPSITIPIGTVDGLPVGMQVMARHRREDLLLELAALAERNRPWPLTAPGR